MNNRIEYKGYTGTVDYCEEDNIFHGKVLGIPKTLIMYHGNSMDDLIKDFRDAIDFYLLPHEGLNNKLHEKGHDAVIA